MGRCVQLSPLSMDASAAKIKLYISAIAVYALCFGAGLVHSWMLLLTFSGDGGESTLTAFYQQLGSNGTQRYQGIPTSSNTCIDSWSDINYVNQQYNSGSRDPQEAPDTLIKYSFSDGGYNPRTYQLYLYNDTVCEGLTPEPGSDEALDQDKNKANAVYDLSGLAGTRVKNGRQVRSFYVDIRTPRLLYGVSDEMDGQPLS
ncbi:hypothetical protein TWF696_007467 [Orbilia brochopaga]|uniref:Uncharacterized protein n=1 Tax=Orbilia brochopaga TaxID=3140254 RepID=A0AAV9URE8_9PEZI